MFTGDFLLVTIWWAVLFVIGSAAFPLTRRLFGSWWDQGYLLSKAVGLAVVTYIVWWVGMFHLLPFRFETILLAVGILFVGGILLSYFGNQRNLRELKNIRITRIILLEVFFFCALLFWAFIKAHEPDIHGLEKFMDYGFSQTILHSDYFPPADMWYAGGVINYYYFGHIMQAILARFSGIDLAYGYNLMLSSLFALCFTMSFGIGVQLYEVAISHQLSAISQRIRKIHRFWAVITGLLAAFLVTLAGNMQTIYAFTQGYNGDQTPPPFWQVLWPLNQFFSKLPDGMTRYWYANATRFIPFTIHEFPSYSFVVSDNHGHVLGIPFALLMIAALFTFFGAIKQEKKRMTSFMLFGGLLGVLFMTNALDTPIYLGLFFFLFIFQSSLSHAQWLSGSWIKEKFIGLGVVFISFIVSTLPFLLTFKSFATGLALNCPPAFLANSRIGPFLFEGVEKCQRSPLWMILVLWGFFFYCGTTFIVKNWSNKTNLTKTLSVMFFYCVGLILFAEVFYFKDIYPMHFRSNTMFKLGYQAFMMLSLLSGLTIIQMVTRKGKGPSLEGKQGTKVRWARRVFFLLLVPQLFLVSIFPYFSIRSYFGNLQTYKGLFGLTWFQTSYPDDYKAMLWLKGTVAEQAQFARPDRVGYILNPSFFTSHLTTVPVIVEADGDSYTDYDRMSAFAGVPTIVGWGVHEWLWRGTYDVVSPRKEEVQQIYESKDLEVVRQLLIKYNVSYVVVGTLEREKFKALQENHFQILGHAAFRSGSTVIYALDKI